MGISYLFYVCSAQFAGSLRGMLMSKKSKVAYNLCYTQLLSNLEQGTGIEPAIKKRIHGVITRYFDSALSFCCQSSR